MAFVVAFIKKALSQWKRKREIEKDKQLLIKDAHDIVNFIVWYLNRRYIITENDQQNGKYARPAKDKELNFVWMGFEAQAHFWKLVKIHPYIAVLTGDEYARISARNRVYPWLDDEGTWNFWERIEMEEHYQAFLANEKVHNIYGDYSIKEVGPLGKSEAYPACAYLSYAYHEEIRWKTILQALISFLYYAE